MKPTWSKLMLGTAQFGLNYGIANIHGKPSYENAKAILKEAFDAGVTALDTAAAYGDSEAVLGRALRELGLAGRMRVVTKVPPLPADADPEAFIAAAVENSLRRLRLEVIPAALFHDEKDFPLLPLLETMIARGLIEQAGVSLDSERFREAAQAAPCVQVPCNPLDRRFDAWIERRSGHTFIRSVYLQGMLLLPEDRILPGLAQWRRKLEGFGMPLNELCMRYLLGLEGEISILTGIDTTEQLKENLRLAALGPLPPELMRTIRETVPLLDESLIRPNRWPR